VTVESAADWTWEKVRRGDEDAAVVVAIMVGLASSTRPGPPPRLDRRSAWGSPIVRGMDAPGPGAWWTSGLSR
jgi:hypothetical protein